MFPRKLLFIPFPAIIIFLLISLFIIPLPRARAEDDQFVPADEQYFNISNPIPTSQNELIEFFWYDCKTCETIQPEVQVLLKQLPSNIKYRRLHVALSRPFTHQTRLAAAIDSLNLPPSYHDKIQHIFLNEPNPPKTFETVGDLAVKLGLDPMELIEAYSSPETQAIMDSLIKITADYEINSVPSFGIAGKYRVTYQSAGDETKMMKVVDSLIKR